jgi:hypothetical protein
MTHYTQTVENALRAAADLAIRMGVSQQHASEFLRKYYEIRQSRVPQAGAERTFAGNCVAAR